MTTFYEPTSNGLVAGDGGELVSPDSPPVVPYPRWFPKTLDDINWALAEKGTADRRVALILAQEAAAHKAIADRSAELVKRTLGGVALLSSAVVAWARDHRDQVVTGQRKTLDLLNGSVSFRSVPGKLTVTDKAALEAWLLTQPPEAGLYRMSIAPEMRALKASVEATGIIPPGCDWSESHEEIHLKPHPLPTLDARDTPELP